MRHQGRRARSNTHCAKPLSRLFAVPDLSRGAKCLLKLSFRLLAPGAVQLANNPALHPQWRPSTQLGGPSTIHSFSFILFDPFPSLIPIGLQVTGTISVSSSVLLDTCRNSAQAQGFKGVEVISALLHFVAKEVAGRLVNFREPDVIDLAHYWLTAAEPSRAAAHTRTTHTHICHTSLTHAQKRTHNVASLFGLQ